MIDGAPINVLDFGATGDGTTDDTVAIQAAWAYAISVGGARIHVPAGTYLVTSAINITGADNVIFEGDGVDNTILTSNSTTANVFYDSGTSVWRTFRDFSIASSVTRTAGSYFYLTAEKRSSFQNLKLTGHFNGFNFLGFEQCWMYAVSITTPSGAGSSIILGTQGTAGSGANIMLDSLFLRGNNDITQNAPTGLYALNITDCDAVFAVNCDIGGFVNNDMLIEPTVRSANHHFTQCFFDATKSSDCVKFDGVGTKQQITFNGCWFSSAGKLTSGNDEACGVRAFNAGTYQDIIFSGCRFYNSSGSGLLAESTNCDFTLSGCNFYFNSSAAVTNQYGFFWAPASVGSIGPNLTGCRSAGNGGGGFRFDANARNYSVVGSNIQDGLSNAGSGGILSKNPGYNPVTSTLSVTASPFSYTNNTGDTQTVVIASGAVSVITLNGLAVGAATNTSVSVPNAGTIVITYSSLPTVLAVGN
jgi:hypothetical protein